MQQKSTNEVMDLVVKTVNFIRPHGLNHRQFKSFLVDMDPEYGELLCHTEVRWRIRRKILKRFFALTNETSLFMKMKNKAIPLLDDPTFQCNLAFLTDMTDQLNELNVKLQGRNQIITQMYDHVKWFKVKHGLWIKQLHEENMIHFSTLKPLGKVEPKLLECLKEYADLLSTVI